MDSLQHILKRAMPQEPDEVLAVKRYVEDHFQASSSVGLQNNTIIITVASAALANTLRLHAPKIQTAANTQKRLIFRIG